MLKLNVGFNRKVGESNYGSRGASVTLELELDSGLVGDPDRLKDRVRQMFLLAKASVDEELNGNGALTGNGQTAGAANGRQQGSTRRATADQVRALRAIAERQSINLVGLLSDEYSTTDPAALSISQASQLIDELKQANGNGAGGRR